MIGVTIGVGETYYDMAKRASESVKHHTPINHVEIIESVGAGFNHSAMCLRVFDMFDHDDVFYFDADTYMVRDWDVTQYDSFAAVCDKQKSIMQKECKQWDLNPEKYINAGVFIANRDKHGHVFAKAQRVYLDSDYNSALYEQTALNVALQEIDPNVTYLPREYNVIGSGKDHTTIPDDAVMLHAAGGSNKSGFQEAIEKHV